MDNLQKFRKFPQKSEKNGIGENFHFSFHYFIRVLSEGRVPLRAVPAG